MDSAVGTRSAWTPPSARGRARAPSLVRCRAVAMQHQQPPPPAVRTVAIPFADLKVSGGARSVLAPSIPTVVLVLSSHTVDLGAGAGQGPERQDRGGARPRRPRHHLHFRRQCSFRLAIAYASSDRAKSWTVPPSTELNFNRAFAFLYIRPSRCLIFQL
jgi:hypothetical protein